MHVRKLPTAGWRAPQDFDRLLSTSTGRPAPFFIASMLSIVGLSSCWLAGTFFTPGLQMAYDATDPLLGLVAVAGWVNTGPCYYVLFTETRRLVRSTPDGELALMGVGATLISPELQAGLLASKRYNHIRSVPGFGLVVLVGGCALSALLVSGAGVHSALHNRLACASFIFFFCTGDGVYHAWLLTLKTATTLVSAKARAIIATIDDATARAEPLSEVEWVAQVLDPSRELIRTPWTRDHPNELAIRAVAAFLLCGMCVLTFLTILGPAEVSSECDELKERLNKMRITTFNLADHERLLILETAFEKSNRGQGIGFCVLGVVVDKPVLYAYTNKLIGVVTFVAPILATWSAEQ
eukprot:SAG31_NODE_6865_length_1866_cov_1.503679_1_plen_353_part_00